MVLHLPRVVVHLVPEDLLDLDRHLVKVVAVAALRHARGGGDGVEVELDDLLRGPLELARRLHLVEVDVQLRLQLVDRVAAQHLRHLLGVLLLGVLEHLAEHLRRLRVGLLRAGAPLPLAARLLEEAVERLLPRLPVHLLGAQVVEHRLHAHLLPQVRDVRARVVAQRREVADRVLERVAVHRAAAQPAQPHRAVAPLRRRVLRAQFLEQRRRQVVLDGLDEAGIHLVRRDDLEQLHDPRLLRRRGRAVGRGVRRAFARRHDWRRR